jgi:hypothetical protein
MGLFESGIRRVLSAVTLTNAASNRDLEISRMVFHRVGSEFFLSALYCQEYGLGRSVPTSSANWRPQTGEIP